MSGPGSSGSERNALESEAVGCTGIVLEASTDMMSGPLQMQFRCLSGYVVDWNDCCPSASRCRFAPRGPLGIRCMVRERCRQLVSRNYVSR